MIPLTFRWSEAADAKLQAKLADIDMGQFGEGHTVNLAMTFCAVAQAVKGFDDFYDTATDIKCNYGARIMRVYLANPALQLELAAKGNRRFLSDEEMDLAIETAFSIVYLKRNGEVANAHAVQNADGTVPRRWIRGVGIAAGKALPAPNAKRDL